MAMLKGFQEGSDILTNGFPLTIGRCRTANFIIPHVNVSRNHCKILLEGSTWKIEDYSSSGTYVNDSLVGAGSTVRLKEGDIIRLGSADSRLSWTFYSLTNPLGSSPVPPHIISKQLPLSNSLGTNFEEATEKKGLAEKRENVISEEKIKNYEEKAFNAIREDCGKCVDNISNADSNPKVLNVKHNEQLKCIDKNKKNEILLNNDDVTNKFELEIQCNINVPIKDDSLKSKTDTINETKNINEVATLKKCENAKSVENHNGKELVEELRQIKVALSDLEGRNSALVDELAAASNETSEASESKTIVLKNLTEIMETEFQCTICSELFVTAVTLGCTHTFCHFCITQWKKKQKTCPICRKKITTETRSLVVDNYIDKAVEKLSAELKERREVIIQERKEVIPVKKCRRGKLK